MIAVVQKHVGAQIKNNDMKKQTRISDLPDGSLFYLTKKLTTLYSLQKIEGSMAIITAEGSKRTFKRDKKTVCIPAEGEENY